MIRTLEVLAGDVVHWWWDQVVRLGAMGPQHRRSRRFARFGAGSMIAFPPAVLYGEQRISIGEGTTVGPYATLSVGMPAQAHERGRPVIVVGDRCTLGKGIGIVAHERVEIGDDVWTGHFVYITDQNHGYEDVDLPIGTQLWKNAPVRVGADSWLGHGVVVLPGADIGRHVVVGAGSVVTGRLPDFSVAVGAPARVIRRYVEGHGWCPCDADGEPVLLGQEPRRGDEPLRAPAPRPSRWA